MLVQCPSCHTTYRIADNLVAAPNPTFRCSRCKHIFALGLKPASGATRKPPEPPPSPPRQEKEPELGFSFHPPETKETEQPGTKGVPRHGMADVPPADVEEAPSFTIPKRDDSWSMTPDDRASEEAVSIKDERPFSQSGKPAGRERDFEREAEEFFTTQDKAGSERPVEQPLDRPISVTPYLILCAALLFFSSALALVHKTRPETIEGLLKPIPWLGLSVVQNNYLRQGIVLQTSRPSFQRILGNREVFVVSGVVLNRNPVKVREIKLEGYIFGSDGKVLERQVITLGNAISAKILRDLTALEISTLQRLSPPKRFEMSPDESANFVIVFLKSSAEIKSFGCRVLSVEET